MTFDACPVFHINLLYFIVFRTVLLNSQHLTNMTLELRARLWLVGSLSDAPRNTSAFGSPSLPAREGGCLNLTCTSHANPAVSEYTWYRIHGERILQIGNGSSLSIQLLNTSNLFFCEVRNNIGMEKSNVYKIDIQSKSIQKRPWAWWSSEKKRSYWEEARFSHQSLS